MIIKDYVANKKELLKEEISSFTIKPKLIIIQVNHDEASNAYVSGKKKDLDYLGARYEHILLDENTSQEELFKLIDKYNLDNDTDGILVQMPLPKQINEEEVKLRINPIKDCDGFNINSSINPCTPQGIITLLEDMNYDFTSKIACIIGRSNIVGKPMQKLLLEKNCTTIMMHSKTLFEQKKSLLKLADLIVVCTGHKYTLDSSYELKKSCYIIDVGINRIDGVLYGDCEPNLDVAFQTPVPGGVGLLTRLALSVNLIKCYKNNRGIK